MGQFLQKAFTSVRCQGKKQENASSRKRFAYVDRKHFFEGALSVHVAMAGELIRFDDKHISVEQMQMSVDRILQCYIRNMTGPPSPLIEDYLRKVGFWHVAMIGRGCKLDPKLISALIERWRLETHTFHLPCGECTITLEDVHLQLGLSVDGDAVTGSVHSADWGAVCYELLGAILDNINGGRIEIGWLRATFLEPDDDSTELKKIRYTRAYILQIIGGYLMPDLSRNLVHLRWLLKLVDFRAGGEFSWGSAVLATLYREMCGATRPNKAKIGGCLSLLQSWARFRFPFLRPQVDHPYTFPLITRWNHSASYARLPTYLEDIRLLLEQRSEAQFQWIPYEDPAIRAVIPDEYLQNPNAWHVKCWMIITKSTYGNCIRIGRDSGHTISKCGKIGMIIYLLGNRSSFQSWRPCRNTCHGLGSMASHIYCQKKRGSDNCVSVIPLPVFIAGIGCEALPEEHTPANLNLAAGLPVQAKSPATTITLMSFDLNYQFRLNSDPNSDYPSRLNPFSTYSSGRLYQDRITRPG
ncbi:hypothetical protein CXB51_034838 [Gossypium anomalum]|uniref:Aminotransferase-like plant mobile domain-containing protein n=1 Tax=Gossypium anomalum TaxID=47600 RepID=A0A8J5Y8M3_9ROSI|nr:hypothetical protein CXB51_034838 [Gossypium anomalum]